LRKNVLIVAGGGGHTGYAYALAQRLKCKASLRFLVPSDDALSYQRLSQFGEVNFLLKARGAKTPNHEFIPRLVKAFLESLNRVSGGYDVIVSTGSNFCLPPSLLGRLRKVSLVNIESSVRFTKASQTARILQPLAAVTALQWKEQEKLLKKGVHVGPLLPQPEISPWNGGYVLVTGGTMGHKKLFDAICESNLENVVLQTGQIDPAHYRRKHPSWKVIRFSTRFFELVAGAEIVVTHFGYTALEALVYRKPTVIVLNPEWKRTVGRTDAEFYAAKVNASLVWDVSLSNLIAAIDEAKKKEQPVLPDGAENLSKVILSL